MTASRSAPVLLFALLTVCASTATPQGRGVQFLNFEAPAHKPVAVVKVADAHYLLVANGPDNSVEVFDTINHQFLFRVPTGQRPVTIAVLPSPTPQDGRQIYVANWLGDSITVFDLQPSAGPHLIEFVPVTTQFVGDEPVGIAFLPENPFDPSTQPGGSRHQQVLVTFSGPAQWGSFLPGSLVPVAPQMELLHAATSTLSLGVRDPRAIAFAPPPMHDGPYNDQVWILNHRGGNDASLYDLDLWGTDDLTSAAISGFSALPAHGGLGTTNTQMAFAPDGDLYVVGLAARNKDPALGNPNLAVGEPIHLNMVTQETGFTTSFLARYGALDTSLAVPEVLDLNNAIPGAVPATQAAMPVSNPTDLAIYKDTKGRTRIFVTGFGSDTLAMVRPGSGPVSSWQVTRISVAHPNKFTATNTGGVMRGPRGLAIKTGATPSDRDRLYVYNRVDQTVSVLAANAAQPIVLSNFPLHNLAEPAYVQGGRKFLASTELSAGGNVACWSCHIDGNTDFLGWNLADGGTVPAPGGPGSLIDALGPNTGFKGVMVTQPLRGLVNFEVAGPAIQDLFFSNRPYHWRGDKGFFEHFNAAFVNLMGLPNLEASPASPAHHRGLAVTDMTAFREFVFSMHYPPNPNQPWTRTYSGTMFDAANPPTNPTNEAAQLNSTGVGAHAQLGLKAFHLDAGCVGCHLLPEGSNNDLTDTFANVATSTAILNNMETAQLKGMTYKERILVRNINNQIVSLPQGQPVARTHEFGLTSSGKNDQLLPFSGVPSPFHSDSVGAFVSGFGMSSTVADAVVKYVREFDSGVGPLVGFTATVDVPTYSLNPAGFAQELTIREAQVKAANAGLAVHAWINGALHGFWYDVTDAVRPYHEVVQTGLPPLGDQSSSALLNLLAAPSAASDFLTFHFTPLGSERRVADLSGGSAGWLAGGAPSAVTLLPAHPMTANEFVPKMVGLPTAATSFTNAVNNPALFGNPAIKKLFTTAHYEKSLIAHAPSLGLAAERFDAPRRFRVSGQGIQDGALVVIRAPTAPGTASTPPATVPGFGATMFWVLPIYPAVDGAAVIWETAVEMEPMFLFALMNGGPFNPVVTQAFFTPYDLSLFNVGSATYKADTQDIMQPMQWNWYFVQVVNQTATGPQTSPGSWQRITID